MKFMKAFLFSQLFCFWCFCTLFSNTVTRLLWNSASLSLPNFSLDLLFCSASCVFPSCSILISLEAVTPQTGDLYQKGGFTSQFWEVTGIGSSICFRPSSCKYSHWLPTGEGNLQGYFYLFILLCVFVSWLDIFLKWPPQRWLMDDTMSNFMHVLICLSIVF